MHMVMFMKSKLLVYVGLCMFLHILLLNIAAAEPMVEFDFLINQSGDVYLYNMRTFFGSPERSEAANTEFAITINDANGEIIQAKKVPASFVILDPFQPVAQVPVSIKVPYTQDAKKLRIYRNDQWLYEEDLGKLCTNDGLCQRSENYASCPQDCKSGSEDGLCDRVEDDVCDPDCVAGDGDCRLVSGMTAYDVVSLGGAIVLTIMLALTLLQTMRTPVEQRRGLRARMIVILVAKVIVIVVPQVLKRVL